MNEDFAKCIGIDVSKMLYIQLETVEDIFEVIENIITKVRESDKDRLVSIVVDSVAAATTKVEQADDFDQTGWGNSKSYYSFKSNEEDNSDDWSPKNMLNIHKPAKG